MMWVSVDGRRLGTLQTMLVVLSSVLQVVRRLGAWEKDGLLVKLVGRCTGGSRVRLIRMWMWGLMVVTWLYNLGVSGVVTVMASALDTKDFSSVGAA